MSKLIDYIIKDHSNLSQKKIAFKFPMVSADILSSNCDAVKEFFSKTDSNGKFNNFDKLISCLDDENHMNEIMSYSQNLDSNIQSFNASANTVKSPVNVYSEINHTRGGYLYKIVNNLLIIAPDIFATYMLKNAELKRSLLKNCQCKSVAMILTTLLTLPKHSNTGNNIMNQPNSMNFNNDNNQANANNQTQNEVDKNTLEQRLELLNEVIMRCMSTVDKPELLDLQNNFCYILNSLFMREYLSRKDFINHIIDKYFEKLVECFMNSQEKNVGNKLGAVVLSLFGTILITRCSVH